MDEEESVPLSHPSSSNADETPNDENHKSKFWDFIRAAVTDSFSSSSSSSSSWSKKFTIPVASFLLVFLFTFAFLSARWYNSLSEWSDSFTFTGTSKEFTFSTQLRNFSDYPKKEQYNLTCPSTNMTITCPSNYPPSNRTTPESKETCPDYFRWIHDDLKTWKRHGIKKDMVESLSHRAHFRLVIVNGTAYVKQYSKAYQTRDVYTLWGILQLLKLYPGRLPDLDLMFQCHDQSSIKRNEYRNVRFAPPQFHYCGQESTLDIVFPDWSFWGWPEINIKPWVPLMKDLDEGNRMKNWTSREPYAFWKGNLYTGARKKLDDCNSIKLWNAKIVNQDWVKEGKEGFKNSELSKQCTHRYKIYIEGNAWSVSEKYILACDSMSLLVNPKYYDFFSRNLIPMKHYWPINPQNLCKSIKFAVNWGNNHTVNAQEIGKEGSDYIFNQVKIGHVYDYMFHVLYEYAKLLRYRPTVPEGVVELCSEEFACSPMGLETDYKAQTMVDGPADRGPCKLGPPFEPKDLRYIRDRNEGIKKQVLRWEKEKSQR